MYSIVRYSSMHVRQRAHCQVQAQRTLGACSGFNRAQSAVIEAAIVTSWLHMLPAEKINSEHVYLQIAIDESAGPRELEAWFG